jgi:hypothetical protein
MNSRERLARLAQRAQQRPLTLFECEEAAELEQGVALEIAARRISREQDDFPRRVRRGAPGLRFLRAGGLVGALRALRGAILH